MSAEAVRIAAVEAVLTKRPIDRRALSQQYGLPAAEVDRIVDRAIAEHLRRPAERKRDPKVDGLTAGQADRVLPGAWFAHPDPEVRRWAEAARRCIEAAAAHMEAAPLVAERARLAARLAAVNSRLEQAQGPFRAMRPCEICGQPFESRGMSGHMRAKHRSRSRDGDGASDGGDGRCSSLGSSGESTEAA